MKLNDIYPSQYLKAADIGDEPMVLTIDRVEMAEMQDGTRKPAVYFREQEKGLILNRTNANAVAAVYGDDTDEWQNARVQLISVPVEFQGKQVDAIRIRARPQKQSQPKPAAKPAYRNPNDIPNDDPPRQAYGEAKARATSGRPMEEGRRVNLDDDLNDPIPFLPAR